MTYYITIILENRQITQRYWFREILRISMSRAGINLIKFKNEKCNDVKFSLNIFLSSTYKMLKGRVLWWHLFKL